MTNREYFKQKKDVFFDKLGDWFVKYFKFIYILCLVLDIFIFISVLKVGPAFLILLFPWTGFCVCFTWALIDLWLDKEHKEKNKND